MTIEYPLELTPYQEEEPSSEALDIIKQKITQTLSSLWGATLKTLNSPISLNKTLSNHLRMSHKLIPSLIPSTFC